MPVNSKGEDEEIGGERVSDFVKTAFPQSTIPYHIDADHRDFSANLLDENADWTKPRKPKGDGRYKQCPVWPADLFGVAASLLERSGAYQRLANSIAPHHVRRLDEFAWNGQLDPMASTDTATDPFGVHGHHRLLLRLIGALWRHGALIISGRHKPDGSVATDMDLLERNKGCVKDAIHSLKDRADRDYSHDCINELVKSIHESLIEDLQLFGASGINGNGRDKYRKCKLSHLILDYFGIFHTDFVVDKDKEADRNEKKVTVESEGLKIIGNYLLILWARHYVESHWSILISSGQQISLPLSRMNPHENDSKWWRAATRLLIIADEAGKGMGFTNEGDGSEDAVTPHKAETASEGAASVTVASDPLGLYDSRGSSEGLDSDQNLTASPLPVGLMCNTIWNEYLVGEGYRRGKAFLPTTLTRCLSDALGAVLPKTRTPGNGCTIRSLSHNLAVLPQKGRVRARWVRQSKADKATSYNILLVPYPFQIKSRHVIAVDSDEADDWGFFSVVPNWLYDSVGVSTTEPDAASKEAGRALFWDFLASLIETQDQSVDAVMLPEAALDGETFDYVQARLPSKFPNIKMFVCGLTSFPPSHPDLVSFLPDRPGNFVATYLRNPKSGSDKGGTWQGTWNTTHVRAKHHRWKLDKGQLETYALSHRLRPDRVWWEHIQLPPREMLFAEFSSGSVVTALICEDLARIEPCQVALRAVGPNLVLVLLMDSAQVAKRWPYQYAGVLSDDPGCSVLTLTSFGLVRRSNLSEDRDSREIAVWREPHTGHAREIKLPKGYDAQLLSIRREFCTEQTLDGRNDNGDSAIVWRYAGLTPIRATCPPPGGRADDNE